MRADAAAILACPNGVFANSAVILVLQALECGRLPRLIFDVMIALEASSRHPKLFQVTCADVRLSCNGYLLLKVALTFIDLLLEDYFRFSGHMYVPWSTSHR